MLLCNSLRLNANFWKGNKRLTANSCIQEEGREQIMKRWRGGSVSMHRPDGTRPVATCKKDEAKTEEIRQTDLVLPESWK